MSNIFDLDDHKLIEKFAQGSNQLLASANLRLEVSGNLSQLLARNGDSIAIMYLDSKPRTAIVKHNSPFLDLIDRLLIDRDFVMFGDASRAGFIEYKHYVTPAGYRILNTDPAILWKKWWPTEKFQDKQRFNMNILVSFKSSWYPVQNITVAAGTFTIKTIAGQLILKRDDKVLWLAQNLSERAETTGIETEVGASPLPAIDSFDRHPTTALAQKIQQKQSEINPDQAWSMIKKLEQKLQAQIKVNSELVAQQARSIDRAEIAERRLAILDNYLKQIGVDPQDLDPTYRHLDR
ncbi:hypothetical protein [Chamaesiphon sp. VAR_69_metabat_338]|uniref:hypothetical protein n=1 Tax=Chamaesiphon sp. VAR_69_metabat_338 TaxID=2964704 RepID=UPI00286E3300|nr:hypothetical protein [Chamaesiphon sp. VAR_69_metabat_338]